MMERVSTKNENYKKRLSHGKKNDGVKLGRRNEHKARIERKTLYVICKRITIIMDEFGTSRCCGCAQELVSKLRVSIGADS